MAQIVDLSFTIREGMQTFAAAWHPVVEITQLGRHGIENRETRRVTLGTHTGTHCDAPRHFIPDGVTIDQVPVDTLVGPARVCDLTKVQKKSAIDAATLRAAAGDDPPQRLILRYDWSDHYGTRAYYTDHPYLTSEAAQWIVQRGVKLVAMDTPMPDDPRNGSSSDNDSPVHHVLLGHGVILVEYLTNVRQLRGRDVQLIVMPLKIKDGDGAPARCVAIG